MMGSEWDIVWLSLAAGVTIGVLFVVAFFVEKYFKTEQEGV